MDKEAFSVYARDDLDHRADKGTRRGHGNINDLDLPELARSLYAALMLKRASAVDEKSSIGRKTRQVRVVTCKS